MSSTFNSSVPSSFSVVRYQLAPFLQEARRRFKQESVLEVIEKDWESVAEAEFSSFSAVVPDDAKSASSLELAKFKYNIRSKFKCADDKAVGVLFSLLSSDFHHLISTSDSAFTNFQRVVDFLKPSTEIAKHSLQREYTSFRFSRLVSISAQLSKFRGLVANMTAAEISPHATSQLAVLEVAFNELSSEWNSRVSLFNMTTQATARNLENFLDYIQETLRNNPQWDSPVATAAAAATVGKLWCNYHRALGDHLISSCPLISPCQHCGLKGHKSAVCKKQLKANSHCSSCLKPVVSDLSSVPAAGLSLRPAPAQALHTSPVPPEPVFPHSLASPDSSLVGVVDTGATITIVQDSSALVDVSDQSVVIQTADSRSTVLAQSGSVALPVGSSDILVPALHAPSFRQNLLSVSQIASLINGTFVFTRDRWWAYDSRGCVVLQGPARDGLYIFDSTDQTPVETDELVLPLRSHLDKPVVVAALSQVQRAVSESGGRLIFSSDGLLIESEEGSTLQVSYPSPFPDLSAADTSTTVQALSVTDQYWLWHSRFGHISSKPLRALVRAGKIPSVLAPVNAPCSVCARTKLVRRPAAKTRPPWLRATRVGERIHCDIAGPMDPESRHGRRFFILFIDEFSRYPFGFTLRHKSDAPDAFRKFLIEFRKLVLSPIVRVEVIRSDRAKELVSAEMRSICDSLGISLTQSAPFVPHANGLAERNMRTVKECMRAILLQSGLPYFWWEEAFQYVLFLRARTPTQAGGSEWIIPAEILTGKPVAVDKLKAFGSKLWFRVAHGSSSVSVAHGKSLTDRGSPGTLVGCETNGTYLCWDGHRVHVSRDVWFDERSVLQASGANTGVLDLGDADEIKAPDLIKSSVAAAPLDLAVAAPQIQPDQAIDPFFIAVPPVSLLPPAGAADVPPVLQAAHPLAVPVIPVPPVPAIFDLVLPAVPAAPDIQVGLPAAGLPGPALDPDPLAIPAAPLAVENVVNPSPVARVARKARRAAPAPVPPAAPGGDRRTSRPAPYEVRAVRSRRPNTLLRDSYLFLFREFDSQNSTHLVDLIANPASNFPVRMEQAFLSVASEYRLPLQRHLVFSPCDVAVADDQSLYSFHVLLTREASDVPSVEDAVHMTEWKDAFQSELSSIHENSTWVLVDRDKVPRSSNIVRNKWVLVKKPMPDSSIRFKARLVAKGFSQKSGVDYFETFAPVAKMATVRIFFALAAKHRLNLRHLDVKNAFLQGDLEEEIYMEQPAHFLVAGQESKVCRLLRPIYGLKQSPRCWNKKLSQALGRCGFEIHFRRPDVCLYVRREAENFVAILVYVDDALVGYNCDQLGTSVIQQLMEEFKMRDLGFPSVFVGLHITKVAAGFVLSQSGFAEEILSFAGMSDCKAVSTPMDTNQKLHRREPDEPHCRDFHLFRQLIGALLWYLNSRPDLCFAVATLCKFVSDPSAIHWAALLRLLQFIQGTRRHGILYSFDGPDTLVGFADSGWKTDPNDGKSMTGYSFLLHGAAVVFTSRKQERVALSTTEAEYYALSSATKEALWCRQILKQFGFPFDSSPTVIYQDNLKTIDFANNNSSHTRMSHIPVETHLVRDEIVSGNIQLSPISSSNMIADIFTKPLPKDKFNQFARSLGVGHWLVPDNS